LCRLATVEAEVAEARVGRSQSSALTGLALIIAPPGQLGLGC
jgi:hypothetical protein